YGLLNERLIAAHAVHADGEDLALLSAAGVKVAHCPRSNARLHNGRAPLQSLIEAGIKLGLGTDSLGSCDDLSPLSEAQFAFNLHRAAEPLCKLSCKEIVQLITTFAAQAIGWSDRIGSLEPGKLADLAVFALPPAPLSEEEKQSINPYDLLICGGARLRDLVVSGEFIVSDGKLTRRW
ncbi:MAG TPA: amidohydrolase family protein, partial [Candidatus Obscuribacterales bacterium]